MSYTLQVLKTANTVKSIIKGTKNSAGYDLFSNQHVIIKPHQTEKIDTGLRMKIPDGYYGKIETRSSYAAKGLITIGGIIDSDYRGNIIVMLHNLLSNETQEIKVGDKIAQIIFLKYNDFNIEEVQKLDETERKGGFGSTDLMEKHSMWELMI